MARARHRRSWQHWLRRRGRRRLGELVSKYRVPMAAAAAVDGDSGGVAAIGWRSSPVHTPEPEFDAMLNGWLLYQSLSCRMWGRTALYQSSGAYRLSRPAPGLRRRSCMPSPRWRGRICFVAPARQFKEGDVQHWWHPQTGQGVRTRISRRPGVAALHCGPLYRGDRRHARSRRACRVSDDAACWSPGNRISTTVPTSQRDEGTFYEHCLRAFRQGGDGRGARPPADRQRRLERRVQPRRDRRAG